jgi:shikimate dehydrogenase
MSIIPEHRSESAPLLRVGLIGDPVAHSYSPRFQQAALDALGIRARYKLWQTSLDQLPARVASLLDAYCLGANVTIPYKQAVLPLLDTVDPLAASIGAVNTIVHEDDYLHGYNTDAPGLLYALLEQGIGEQTDAQASTPLSPHAVSLHPLPSLQGYTAVLLGAGGAARGAAFALAGAKVTRLIIVNRHLERAQQLAVEVQQGNDCQVFSLNDPQFLIPHPRSLIINATSVGMHVAEAQARTAEQEDASPLPAEVLARFAPDTFVFDMVYNPIQTRLLCQARMLGLRAVNGLPMLLHQGALAFTLWTKQPAPLQVMRAALM